ncbi:helix-hairpin-helix domain-containing protein [Mucilaginibacter celer]|uniref:Helix-hairpin-helix domain-containing protein n=1 Tax=Mucilaginibacter celer TaxID=2305508 RepID=A0A494VRS3_9SPHI|nr:helix-hairpin-helix domain-containing protein [Mucilaginibacter celer]AYL97149.1 hypothetical protein HYN43_018365 [Mucilaginibacter celer]
MIPQIKHYLSISKKEWNGMVVLIILIALVLAAPYIYQANHKDKTINFNTFDKAANTITKNAGFDTDDAELSKAAPVLHPLITHFNPNKLTVADWVKMGLSQHQATVIKHYQEKGGRFYTKGDVQKMYSINAETYKRLEPYIDLPDGPAYIIHKAKPGEVIEINSADSARLTMIRGIGPAFARRIVHYRERVGGFYSKEQLKEVYGIDEGKYNQMKDGVSVDSRQIVKVNINRAMFNDLKRFPYLSFKQMDAIVAYRDEHGSYHSIKDLENIAILNAQILRKIEPYLIFK